LRQCPDKREALPVEEEDSRMPQREPCTVIDVATALGGGEIGPFPFEQFARKALAQGDSWMSIGALPPGRTTNLLLEMAFARRTVIVQCARPGKVLRRFTDTTREKDFLRMMNGPVAGRWDVILISGVGNDVIAAVGSDPTEPPERRLLRTPAERGSGPLAPAAYLSEPGWAAFVNHIRFVFEQLVDLRDKGPNLRVPMVMHNYGRLMPRPSGAGLGAGPWMHPSFEAYAIAQADRLAVSDELTTRMDALLRQLIAGRLAADPAANLHLVDTKGLAGIALAQPGAEGSSGDWVNEIHLTRDGYRKCTAVWADVVDPILG
jgi:hypothetical protein